MDDGECSDDGVLGDSALLFCANGGAILASLVTLLIFGRRIVGIASENCVKGGACKCRRLAREVVLMVSMCTLVAGVWFSVVVLPGMLAAMDQNCDNDGSATATAAHPTRQDL